MLLRFWKDENESLENLCVDGLHIPEVEATKFLGIQIDNNLNWDHHVTNLVNKLNSNHYLLFILKKLLSEKNLAKLYYTHIYSHIKYGIVTWGSMAKKIQLNSIYTVQKKCVHLINKQEKSSSIPELLKYHQLLKVQDIVELEQCKFVCRLNKNLLPKSIMKLMESRGGKKPHRYPMRNKKIPNIQRHHSTVLN